MPPARAKPIKSADMNPGRTSEPSREAEASPGDLRARGVDRLRTNAFAEAIELSARAVTAEPQDAPSFDVGVERYRAGAYAEAEAIFARLRAAQEAADESDPATLR